MEKIDYSAGDHVRKWMDEYTNATLDELTDDEILSRTFDILNSNSSLFTNHLALDIEYKKSIRIQILKLLLPEIQRWRKIERDAILAAEEKKAEENRLKAIANKKLEEERQIIKGKFYGLVIAIREVEPTITVEFAFQRQEIMSHPGIYFLLTEGDGLLYIGQAQNIKARLISNHPVYNRDKNIVIQAYPVESLKDRLRIEAELIARCNPSENIKCRANPLQERLI